MIRGLVSASPITLPSFSQPSINVSVLIVTMACALGCGLLLGLAPVLHTRIARLADALKSSSRGTSGVRTQRTRSALVVAEVALAVVLLVGASLMIRSVQKLAALEPGFDPDKLLSLTVNIPAVPSAPAAAAPAAPQGPPPLVVSSADLLEQIRAVPGVVDASLVTDVPLGGNDSAVFYTAEGDSTADAATVPRAYVHGVWPGFFRTMGIAVKGGRDFAAADLTGDASAVIISENVARRFWPGQDAIGRRIKQGPPASTNPWLTIVGVVDEVKYRGLPENPTADPDLYFPFVDRRPGQSLVIRTSVPASNLTVPIRDAIRALHPRIVIYNISTMDTLIAAQTAPSTFTTWLLTMFAGIALVLSVVGIYGVMSHLVAQRSREFGIRLALGAGRGEIVGLVLRNGVLLVGVGAAIGIATSFAITRVLGSLLFQVTTVDPASVMAVGVIVVVAIGACCVPALRAARLDPITTLRAD
jgi:putative ABC transport system permease protein